MEKRVVFHSKWLPYALLAPQIAVTVIFFFWPALQAVYYSFMLQDPFGLSTQWVWFENYVSLFKDENYLASFRVTAVFSLLVASSGIVISLLLATMADRVVRGAVGYKTFLIWPYAVAPAIAGVLWAFLFAPSIGIVTYALRKMGIDWNWIINGDQAMLLIVIAATWKQISYNFLFFLAGLQSIPRSLIEAAAIDGATGLRRLWHVTLPMLSPVIFFNLVMAIIATLQVFAVPFVMTRGEPDRATYFYTMYLYDNAFTFLKMGYASAMAWVQLVMIMVLTAVAFWSARRWVHYEA